MSAYLKRILTFSVALAVAATSLADGQFLARSFYSGETVVIKMANDGTVLSTKTVQYVPSGGETFAIGALPGAIAGGCDVATQVADEVLITRYDADGKRVSRKTINVIAPIAGIGDLNQDGANELVLQKPSGLLIGLDFDADLTNKREAYRFSMDSPAVGIFQHVSGIVGNRALLSRRNDPFVVKIATFTVAGVTSVSNEYNPWKDDTHYTGTNGFQWDPVNDSIGGLIDIFGNGTYQVFVNHRPGRWQRMWNFSLTGDVLTRIDTEPMLTPVPNWNYQVLASGSSL